MNRTSYVVLPAAMTLTAGIVALSNPVSAGKNAGKPYPEPQANSTRVDVASISMEEGGIAGVSFTENFESGFNVGPGCNQNGWTGYCGPNLIDGFQIQANGGSDPASFGAISARHNSDGTAIAGFEVVSPIFTLETGRIEADVRIDTLATEYQFVAVNTLAGFFNTRVHFEDTGVINVLQVDPACTVGSFSAASATWSMGTVFRIGVETDGTTLRIYKDGALIFTGSDINATCAAAAAPGINQVRVWAENRTGAVGANMLLDNIGPAAGPTCPADLNGDSNVNVSDLVAVILGWGTPSGDVNGDGTTNVGDLVAVILAWGAC